MYTRSRRRLYSQNFLSKRELVNKLVRQSSIGFQDTVLEIGPGQGMITQELLAVACRVIAVEIDGHWVRCLTKRFARNPKLELHQADILNFTLPKFPYKVFANLPFQIEGRLIRRLLDTGNPPEECYLVVRTDFAQRLSGIKRECQFSLIHKPWFEFSIVHQFQPTDFAPKTKVASVLWRIQKRQRPFLPIPDRKKWERFIRVGFGTGQPVNRNLKRYLGHNRYRDLVSRLDFSLHRKPGQFSLGQWKRMYKAIIVDF